MWAHFFPESIPPSFWTTFWEHCCLHFGCHLVSIGVTCCLYNGGPGLQKAPEASQAPFLLIVVRFLNNSPLFLVQLSSIVWTIFLHFWYHVPQYVVPFSSICGTIFLYFAFFSSIPYDLLPSTYYLPTTTYLLPTTCYLLPEANKQATNSEIELVQASHKQRGGGFAALLRGGYIYIYREREREREIYIYI